jgi:transcriptional regulator with XRE-family HTH domain
MPTARREPVPNIDLYNVRDAMGETQEQTAAALNRLARGRSEATAITGNHVSRWERGIVHPSRLHSKLLAEHFGRSLDELGLTRQRYSPAERLPDETMDTDVLLIEHLSDAEMDRPVIASQQEWMRTRRRLNTDHLRLAQTAAQLYPESARITSLGLLSRPEWIFSQPVDLDAITLTYNGAAASPAVKGNEPFANHVRPLHAIGGRYQRYSQAIRDIARPTLFENSIPGDSSTQTWAERVAGSRSAICTTSTPWTCPKPLLTRQPPFTRTPTVTLHRPPGGGCTFAAQSVTRSTLPGAPPYCRSIR